MLCKEIMKVIEASYPPEAALSFDNVGLLAGRSEKEVKKVYIALDATESVIEQAKKAGADMLITHHPLIFSPLKCVTDRDFISRRVVALIQSDIAYYAMHTNYDVLGMAALTERILQLKNTEVLDVTMEKDGREEGIGRVGTLPRKMSLEECGVYVKHTLKLGTVKIFGNMEQSVSRLAISPGSGKSAVSAAIRKKADVLVTGDIGHHDGLDAVEQGLSIIDAGHYGTEYVFIEDMKHFLEKKLPGLEVTAAPVVHPFQVV
ncbi:Nif3-like dinuclear metal center hexameric protein [Faecalicatena acetigenes]|uniref:GTP cyclohydrolase 1 type 2 homolog n=1 Tax=Faecalicatena acetigenes TaxID=2981790 RepID=A0ABT2TE57_9FIRM|nr:MULTISPECIES: Nif3-like dinuclear metal center hexameric protein [Lachnospiraceae]MCU6748578.1 Nif3-like dinuclear metal center hexameric protein [Faecalicatena acetigenes]SCI52465.1 metal-binding protein [uncultured Clostridium sp.]